MKQLPIFDGRAALYFYEESEAESLPQDWASTVAPHEKERAAKMGSKDRAATFLKARALLRHTLGTRLGAVPGELPIELTPEGKPFLRDGMLAFSLSHARGLVLVGVAESGSLGVDLEYMDPATDIGKIGARLFGPEDHACIAAAVPDKKRAAAFEAWCRYEARFKCGAGNAGAQEVSGLFNGDFTYAVAFV